MPISIVTRPNYFTFQIHVALLFACLHEKQKQEAFPKTPSRQWAPAPNPDAGRH